MILGPASFPKSPSVLPRTFSFLGGSGQHFRFFILWPDSDRESAPPPKKKNASRRGDHPALLQLFPLLVFILVWPLSMTGQSACGTLSKKSSPLSFPALITLCVEFCSTVSQSLDRICQYFRKTFYFLYDLLLFFPWGGWFLRPSLSVLWITSLEIIFVSIMVVVSLSVSLFLFLSFVFFFFLVAGLHRTTLHHNWPGHVRRAARAPPHALLSSVWETQSLSFTSAPSFRPVPSWSPCMYLMGDSKPTLPSPCPRLCIRLISVMSVSLLFFFQ